ncbi:hypothetical protein P4H71_09295 [Paenibacillus kribbensis]|uniref:hypothetical protein n=1 Tax=Paenibacillus kribbensis TaxID=172713 RepID=UPI002DC030FF|nr:hypothetical protein [Paenibacillus kribbensis]MEC0234521.1 hypothetical protein [Paenibacillus kribbensis]
MFDIDLTKFKDFIPLLSAIVIAIGWAATYYFNLKLKTRETFIAKTEQDIKNILGHMSAEIRDIWDAEGHIPTQKKVLKEFYNKYRAGDSPLYLSTSSLIIDQFQHFQDHYKNYDKEPTLVQLQNVWTSLSRLEQTVNNKLKEYRKVLFKHYDWYHQLDSLNPIVRLIAEIFKIIYQTVTGLLLLSLLVVLTTCFEYIAVKIHNIIGSYSFPIFLWPYRYYTGFIAIILVIFWLISYALNLSTFKIKQYSGSSKYTEQEIEHQKKIRPFPTFQEGVPPITPKLKEGFLKRIWNLTVYFVHKKPKK